MNKKTHSMVLIALFGAIISIISIIPTGIYILGVPATLQTFAIAMTAYLLGSKNGTNATLVYILLGLIGLPVFSGFKGGPGVLFSVTGGFIIGFIVLSMLVGMTVQYKSKVKKVTVSFIGLLICYIIGTVWFSVVSKTAMTTAFLVVALPYLPKDILSMFAAYLVADRLKKSIKILEKDK